MIREVATHHVIETYTALRQAEGHAACLEIYNRVSAPRWPLLLPAYKFMDVVRKV